MHAFTTATDAVRELDTFHPDLIVSDILMPEIDGLAFARIVRRRGGIPLMFVSIAKKQAEAVLAGAVGSRYRRRATSTWRSSTFSCRS